MPVQPKLSALEMAVCRDLGITEAAYAAQKAKEVAIEAHALVREDRGLHNRDRGVEIPSAPGLNRQEAETCYMMNISPADFIRTRDAGISINSTGGIKGRQVLDEALSQPPKSKNKTDRSPAYGEGPEDSVESLVASAMEALKSFRANPDDKDGWMVLAQAARCLVYAIDQCAPAFADRPDAAAS